MIKLLLWFVLLVVSWPLAIAALVLYPVIWLLLLPVRFVVALVAAVGKLVLGAVRVGLRVVEQSV